MDNVQLYRDASVLSSVTWVQVRFMHFSGSVTLCPTSSSRVKLEYLHKSSTEAGP